MTHCMLSARRKQEKMEDVCSVHATVMFHTSRLLKMACYYFCLLSSSLIICLWVNSHFPQSMPEEKGLEPCHMKLQKVFLE